MENLIHFLELIYSSSWVLPHKPASQSKIPIKWMYCIARLLDCWKSQITAATAETTTTTTLTTLTTFSFDFIVAAPANRCTIDWFIVDVDVDFIGWKFYGLYYKLFKTRISPNSNQSAQFNIMINVHCTLRTSENSREIWRWWRTVRSDSICIRSNNAYKKSCIQIWVAFSASSAEHCTQTSIAKILFHVLFVFASDI